MSIDKSIIEFEKELQDMDENLILYGMRIKAMKDYIRNINEKYYNNTSGP